MASSATAIGSRCRRCWPASPTQSRTKAFSISSRTQSGMPTASGGVSSRSLPERRGVLIIDGTSFPKQGTHSVGVARQYCGALGKIANCQVATTAALWTGARAWLTGALLYLPKPWLEADQRAVAHVPGRVVFQEKWRQALTLIRRARARRDWRSRPCSRTPSSATSPFYARCTGGACRMPWESPGISRCFPVHRRFMSRRVRAWGARDRSWSWSTRPVPSP